MALQDDFDNQCRGLVNPGEIDLFRALAACFTGPNAYTQEFHGTSFLVGFDVPSFGLNIRREPCDLLFIFIGNGEIRFTFMQNKFSDRPHDDVRIPNVDPGQHFLLSNRPVLTNFVTPFSANTFSNAILPGIGSFGNFYHEDNHYGMVYFDAFTLVPYAPLTRVNFLGHNCRMYVNSYDNNLIFSNGFYYEFVHATNLNDFQNKYSRMLIGSPVGLDDSKFVYSILINCLENKHCHLNSKAINDLKESEEYVTNKKYSKQIDFDNLGEFTAILIDCSNNKRV